MAERACTTCGRLKNLVKANFYQRNDGTFRAQCRTCELAKRRQRDKDRQPDAPFPDPIPRDELAPDDADLLDDGMFPAFFERFAGLGPLPDHGHEWVELVETNPNLILNVPSGHAKTTIFEWYVIWLFCRDRDEQILWLSKSEAVADRSARSIGYILEFHEDLNRSYGRFRHEEKSWPWRPESGEFMIAGRQRATGTGDFSFQARGSRQHILGVRSTLVVADDITDRRVAQSETESTREEEWFRGDVISRLTTDDDRVVILGQRVHSNDLYARLLMPDDGDTDAELVYVHEVRPAVLQFPTPENGEEAIVLWPDKKPWSFLRKQMKRMGSDLFQAYFQQAPAGEGGGIREEWVAGCLDHDRGWGQPREKVEGERHVRVVSVDPSPTQFAGIVTEDLHFHADGMYRRDVLDVRRPFNLGIEELVGVLANLQALYHADVLIIEVNSLKIIMRDTAWERIRKLFKNQVYSHNTTNTNKNNEELGLWAMRAQWEFGRIRLPYADEQGREQSNLLIQEVLGKVPTTDVMMAAWFIFHNAQRIQFYGSIDFGKQNTSSWHVPPRLVKGTARGAKPTWPWLRKKENDGGQRKLPATGR